MTTYVTVVFREQCCRSAPDCAVCSTIRSSVKFAIQYMSFYDLTFYLWAHMPLKVDGTFP